MKLDKSKRNNADLSVKVEDIGERTVRFVISKTVEDRDGDVLHADGVDFTNYMKNPVFLSFHNSREFPLGKVTKFWVEDDKVKADVYFPTLEELATDPTQASEKAKLVDFCYHCYKNGMLNAVSVGFIPLEWTETKTGYDVTKWELLEFSAVAVPANQDAIAEAVKSFGEDFTKSFIVNEKTVFEKSGKKISAETRKVLDDIKAKCDRLEVIEKEMKECRKELLECLKALDDIPEEEKPEGTPEENGCTDEDKKSLDVVGYELVELPDLK